MNVRPRDRATPRSFPRNQGPEGSCAWTPWTTPARIAISSPHERIQREHELGRALDAARLLQERLELAGLEDNAVAVHRIRDDVASRLSSLAVAHFVDDKDLESADFYDEASLDLNLEGDPAFNGAFAEGRPIERW